MRVWHREVRAGNSVKALPWHQSLALSHVRGHGIQNCTHLLRHRLHMTWNFTYSFKHKSLKSHSASQGDLNWGVEVKPSDLLSISVVVSFIERQSKCNISSELILHIRCLVAPYRDNVTSRSFHKECLRNIELYSKLCEDIRSDYFQLICLWMGLLDWPFGMG